jgi:DNA polymerase-3 subunit epsilon
MRAHSLEACGCFPTGRHYAGIAHLLRTLVRGLVEGFAADARWRELPIALIDVETTGRDASVDRVVEVGIAIARGGEIVERKNWRINPGRPIPKEASDIHKITDEDVASAPLFAAVASEIAAALSECIPAAYNAAFDRAFLANEIARAGAPLERPPPALRRDVEWIDPLVWARELQQDEKSRALGEVAAPRAPHSGSRCARAPELRGARSRAAPLRPRPGRRAPVAVARGDIVKRLANWTNLRTAPTKLLSYSGPTLPQRRIL